MLIRNANVYENGRFERRDFSFSASGISLSGDAFDNCFVFPGFVDVHVHFREPGFSYKETIKTGALAAAHGGYTAVCAMGNLNPAPDTLENLALEEELIKDACIKVLPYGTITKGLSGGELSDMEALAPRVAAFSDDGRGVQTGEMMEKAMIEAKSLGKIIVAHCEDDVLRGGGYIHDGAYAHAHGHAGISSESEYVQIGRDLTLAEKIGCKYHVCHVSTKESVDVIRKAKARGVDVTCETAPHYLVLTEDDLKDDGRFKMNPPLREKADCAALIEGLLDGTIDMIATDHAPHSKEEKSKGLKDSAMGIVGLETAFSVLYTHLVKTGILPLEKLIYLMSVAPRARFGIDIASDFTVFDLNREYTIDPNNFLSMGKSTPFEGERVFGKCLLTVHDGGVVYCGK